MALIIIENRAIQNQFEIQEYASCKVSVDVNLRVDHELIFHRDLRVPYFIRTCIFYIYVQNFETKNDLCFDFVFKLVAGS